MVVLIVSDTAAARTPAAAYQSIYEKVDRKDAGPYKDGLAGRNLADDGLANGKAATPKQLRDGITVMRRMLHPAPVAPAPVAPAPEPVSYSAPAPTGGSGCVGMEAESGSAGYSAYNPASGATGCYQIIPSTAAAYGCDLSSPAGQDTCAARICAGQGSGAWASSGASPC